MPQPDAKPSFQGSFRLFRVFGITVYLHWSWFLVAVLQIQHRAGTYTSPVWNLIEYLTLFAIVLLHEFGHMLACRQVGGQANQIVLWPLGGIAFVAPPPRPGAVLWSIAAGPLVNVVLIPVTVAAYLIASQAGLGELVSPDLLEFLKTTAIINGVLLAFNMLPIYPLDGGQIVQALLWFVIGHAKSLLVVSIIGMITGSAVVLLALATQSFWLGVIAVFAAVRSLAGFKQSRLLARLENAPRHEDAVCPSCQASPVMGRLWVCDECQNRFDIFRHQAICPECGKQFPETCCPSCGAVHRLGAWFAPVEAIILEAEDSHHSR